MINSDFTFFFYLVPLIKIIVASPPKEVQSEPDLDLIKEDIFNLNDNDKSSKPKELPTLPFEIPLNYEDDDIPEDTPLNIIESTIFTFSL